MTIEGLMEHDVAGDPISGLKWTRRSTGAISEDLATLNIKTSSRTVSRILRKLKYALRVNHKKLSYGSRAEREERNEQFEYIAEQREQFRREGNPSISIDTKKKELIGNFKNNGVSWQQKGIPVNDHDFRSQAIGIGIPYGIYTLGANIGTVFVGTSFETPEFATDCIRNWWLFKGRYLFQGATKLLILADGGGSNRPGSNRFKLGLQEKLCDKHDLEITVCHYPTGASKWNPIEHRYFCQISRNWSGIPLRSLEIMLNYIETTKTSTGLTSFSYLIDKLYTKGIVVPQSVAKTLSVRHHEVQPRRNYTLSPRANAR